MQIQIDAPRQLTLDAIFDQVRTEYRRATETASAYPIAEPNGTPLRVSDNHAVAYEPSPTDPVLSELKRVGSAGATARELQESTSVTKHRVGKRLKELLDARLVTKQGPRYYPAVDDSSATVARSKSTEAGRTRTLFSEMELQAHRGQS